MSCRALRNIPLIPEIIINQDNCCETRLTACEEAASAATTIVQHHFLHLLRTCAAPLTPGASIVAGMIVRLLEDCRDGLPCLDMGHNELFPGLDL